MKGDYLASLNPLSVIEWMLRYPTMTLNNFFLLQRHRTPGVSACMPVVTIPWVAFVRAGHLCRRHCPVYVQETENGDPIVTGS